jgi:hypothetical protein
LTLWIGDECRWARCQHLGPATGNSERWSTVLGTSLGLVSVRLGIGHRNKREHLECPCLSVTCS